MRESHHESDRPQMAALPSLTSRQDHKAYRRHGGDSPMRGYVSW